MATITTILATDNLKASRTDLNTNFSNLNTDKLENVVEDTTPQLGGQLDVNGQALGDGTLELLKFLETASAVNELTITNAATAGTPSLSATGDDADIDLNLISKGTGVVQANGSGLVTASSTDTFTNKTFDANATGNSLSNVDVADLANGTDGELITWDSAGVAATVPVGTSGQLLTSNGAGAAPTFQSGAGEANTASNQGAGGVGVFKQKTGVDLEFKNINAANSSVTITDDTGNDEIDIDVAAASTTLAGKVELATAAETTTGTDATRALTPDGLAGSDQGKRVIGTLVFDNTADTTTGDGANGNFLRIPSVMNGYNLVEVAAQVFTAGTTGTLDIQIANVTDTVDMLSTKITIDSTEKDSSTAATPAVIDAANDDVATGDQLRIDVDAVHTTAAKGLFVELTFQLP